MFRVSVAGERAWGRKGLFSQIVETISLPASLPRQLVLYHDMKEWVLFPRKKTDLFLIRGKMKVFAGDAMASL